MALHPYRTIWQSRDLQAWENALAPDVVLYSPIIVSPFRGKGTAVELFAVLLETLTDFEITHESVDSGRHAFAWSATALGRTIQGVDLIDMDEDGRISEITVLIRPLVSIATFAAAIGPPLAARRSRARAVVARILIAPLRVILAIADRISTRLVQG